MFQPGFPISKRLLNFVYKGTIFAIIGMMAGTIGTSISNGLLYARWVHAAVLYVVHWFLHTAGSGLDQVVHLASKAGFNW